MTETYIQPERWGDERAGMGKETDLHILDWKHPVDSYQLLIGCPKWYFFDRGSLLYHLSTRRGLLLDFLFNAKAAP